jgi:MFS family permease
MGKCIKGIVLSVIAAVFGVLALSGPVFATPNTNDNNPGNDTTIVTDEPTDTNPDEEADDDKKEKEDEESSTPSCYDQVGSLGWIICPGAGLFGNVIDGAYDLLTQIIEVNPIPTDTSSPTYVVWEYFKDITNSIFIIFLLVIVFSQITGFGINNYGIKKALPRIVISAILVNLSYIICTLAVDVSNILGNAFQSFFVNVQNIAIENGSISDVASSTSVSGLVAAMLGIGTGVAALGVAATIYGGIGGVIWLLLPILLSGLIAVISAVVTMAARQAFIYLLIMISPLALVAYMLPNTEKWFQRWYRTLAQMLFFYPMFSILYGASQLAGLVIITSATNWLGIVLGIAVKILPLFMSIPLMRMSNSILGKISGVIGHASRHPMAAFGRYSASHQVAARNRQLTKQNPALASTRLAQYLEKRRALREANSAEDAAINKMRNDAYVREKWYNRDGTVSKRGYHHIENEQAKMRYAANMLNAETDIDEGFKDDGTDKRVRTRDLAKLRAINRKYDSLIVDSATAESRKRSVALANMEHRAKLIQDNVESSSNIIHQRVLDAFNINAADFDSAKAKKEAYDDAVTKREAIRKKANGERLNSAEQKILQKTGNTLTAAETAALATGGLTVQEKTIYDSGQKAINATLADAITAKRKVDREARSNYIELFDNYEAGPRIKQKLIEAFQNKDYNSASAALEIMYKRGDKDDIGDVLKNYSKEVMGEENIRFQKELNDICLSFKAEDLDVAQWAKANMMRRGMNGKGKQIEAYIDYETWARGGTLVGDIDTAAALKTSRIELGNALSSWEAIATADRTMWNQMLDDQKAGIVIKGKDGKPVLPIFPIKYLRSAVCSGKMDGERLESFNKFFTGGFKLIRDTQGNVDWAATKNSADNAFFYQHMDSYASNVEKFLSEMSANQLGTLKTATLESLNNVLLAKFGTDQKNVTMVDGKMVSNKLTEFLDTQINQFNTEKSMAGQRTAMNPAVRKMLGIKDVL